MPSGSTNEKRPWFPFYPLDWRTSSRVRCMSIAARGVFIDALCIQWLEGSMPTDIERWRRLFRDASDSDLQDVMDAFPGGKNQRLERERAIADEIGLRRGESARKANTVRWGSETDHGRIRKDPHRQVQSQEQEQSQSERKPRAARTGPHAELIQHFEARWLDTRGVAYAFQPKDGAAASKALKLAGGDLGLAKDRIEVMLTSSDSWVAQHASLPLLVSQWNQFAVTVVPRSKSALQNTLDGLAAMGMDVTAPSLKAVGQ